MIKNITPVLITLQITLYNVIYHIYVIHLYYSNVDFIASNVFTTSS